MWLSWAPAVTAAMAVARPAVTAVMMPDFLVAAVRAVAVTPLPAGPEGRREVFRRVDDGVPGPQEVAAVKIQRPRPLRDSTPSLAVGTRRNLWLITAAVLRKFSFLRQEKKAMHIKLKTR